jgi:hypothetical protein
VGGRASSKEAEGEAVRVIVGWLKEKDCSGSSLLVVQWLCGTDCLYGRCEILWGWTKDKQALSSSWRGEEKSGTVGAKKIE